MAAGNAFLLLILIGYALLFMGLGYILIHVYRSRHRKVRKLR